MDTVLSFLLSFLGFAAVVGMVGHVHQVIERRRALKSEQAATAQAAPEQPRKPLVNPDGHSWRFDQMNERWDCGCKATIDRRLLNMSPGAFWSTLEEETCPLKAEAPGLRELRATLKEIGD